MMEAPINEDGTHELSTDILSELFSDNIAAKILRTAAQGLVDNVRNPSEQ